MQGTHTGVRVQSPWGTKAMDWPASLPECLRALGARADRAGFRLAALEERDGSVFLRLQWRVGPSELARLLREGRRQRRRLFHPRLRVDSYEEQLRTLGQELERLHAKGITILAEDGEEPALRVSCLSSYDGAVTQVYRQDYLGRRSGEARQKRR